jgi:hypothetical protein
VVISAVLALGVVTVLNIGGGGLADQARETGSMTRGGGTFPGTANKALLSKTFPVQTVLAGDCVRYNGRGKGTMRHPYLIDGANLSIYSSNLYCFRHLINSGNSAYLDKSWRLTSDVNLTRRQGAEWVPVGTAKFPFTGVFDCDGHVIKHVAANFGDLTHGFFDNIKGAGIMGIEMDGTKYRRDTLPSRT